MTKMLNSQIESFCDNSLEVELDRDVKEIIFYIDHYYDGTIFRYIDPDEAMRLGKLLIQYAKELEIND